MKNKHDNRITDSKEKFSTEYLSDRISKVFATGMALLVGVDLTLIISVAKGGENIWLLLFFLCVTVLYPLIWNVYVKRPFLNTEDAIKRFNEGFITAGQLNREKLYPSASTRELIRRVSEMLSVSQSLSVSKRQAQYLALQNQINPHFLYNTLDSIRSEVYLAGLYNVADMTEALATFFRYTISKVENLVTIEDELDNCRNYFRIQQYRFGERIQLQIEADDDAEEIRNALIPKLTLQPILENSIIHGTEMRIDHGISTIRLTQTDDRIIITVSDNGVGMDQETLQKLNMRLNSSSHLYKSDISRESGNGIALENVSNRIHLLFGAEYGLHIYSIRDVGTDVEISIPKIYDENELQNIRKEFFQNET